MNSMTGRTHDLAAFTTLNLIVATHPIPEISLATLVTAIGANLIGGIAPDIDEATSDIWHKIPAGTFIGELVTPFLGGHRLISHSLVGLTLFGIGAHYLLQAMSSVLLVDMNIVWWGFMIGVFSHLVTDSLTKEGVPWLFPIPYRFGFPPLHTLRIRTGGPIEKFIVFPSLIILNGIIVTNYYEKYLTLLHHMVK